MKSSILAIQQIGFPEALAGGVVLTLPVFIYVGKKLYDIIYLKKTA